MSETNPTSPLEQERIIDLHQPTSVEAFDGVLPLVHTLMDRIGEDGLRDTMEASLLIGGRSPDDGGIFYKPQRDGYHLLHLRAGFDEAELMTEEPMRRLAPGIAVVGAMAAWELFRAIGEERKTSVLEGEQSFEEADYMRVAGLTRSMYKNVLLEKLAWAQTRDDEEKQSTVAPLHSEGSGFSNLTAHLSIALANVRGAALMTEDHEAILDTYRYLRDSRRELSGEKRTYKVVRKLIAAMDNLQLTDMKQAIELADEQGNGVEIMVRAIMCRVIDDTVASMSRVKEKKAHTERAEAKAEYLTRISHFRTPHISEAIHGIMQERVPALYDPEVVLAQSNEEQANSADEFEVDTWMDEPLFPGSKGEQDTQDVQRQPSQERTTVPSAFVDRERLAMLERIKMTWTVGAKSIGSLFEGENMRRYLTDDGEVFTDKYYGVVVPVYENDKVVSYFLVAESAVAGRNVTIVYRSDVGDLPWQDVARMSKNQARGLKGVKFLTHTKVGDRSVVETTEEKLEYLFTCSAHEYEHGRFKGETSKGELKLALGQMASAQALDL